VTAAFRTEAAGRRCRGRCDVTAMGTQTPSNYPSTAAGVHSNPGGWAIYMTVSLHRGPGCPPGNDQRGHSGTRPTPAAAWQHRDCQARRFLLASCPERQSHRASSSPWAASSIFCCNVLSQTTSPSNLALSRAAPRGQTEPPGLRHKDPLHADAPVSRAGCLARCSTLGVASQVIPTSGDFFRPLGKVRSHFPAFP